MQRETNSSFQRESPETNPRCSQLIFVVMKTSTPDLFLIVGPQFQ